MDLNLQIPTSATLREIIEETETVTYNCYSEIGEPDSGIWNIMRVEKVGNITSIKWAVDIPLTDYLVQSNYK